MERYKKSDPEVIISQRDHSLEDARTFAILGSIVSGTIFIGFFLTVLGLIQTFEDIQLYGTGDPKLMAGGISQALVPTVIFGFLGFLGLLSSFLTVIFSKYRAKWFFRLSIFFSIVYLIWLPLGTILGLFFIVVLVSKRKEFRKSSDAT